jgi:hypothetical protein
MVVVDIGLILDVGFVLLYSHGIIFVNGFYAKLDIIVMIGMYHEYYVSIISMVSTFVIIGWK